MTRYERTAWWGKAGKAVDCHPLIWHSLDVAAVGSVLLEKHVSLRTHLARSLDMTDAQLRNWVINFLAIHDVGKYSYRFQNLRRDLCENRLGSDIPDREQSCRHDQLGFVLWQADVLPLLRGHLGPQESVWTSRRIDRYLNQWALIACGHHGQPPKQVNGIIVTDHFSQKDRDAAKSFSQEVLSLFSGSELTLPEFESKKTIESIKKVSWLLAGVFTLADWLGSNREYFEFHDRDESLESYWHRALQLAHAAVEISGVLPAVIQPFKGLVSLFPAFVDYELSPLQQLAETIVLNDQPRLVICEDVTGAGKTEASLVLAHRLMQCASASGLYFALPTMATANAMFGRAQHMYKSLFLANESASLVLSHSGRDLDHRFKQLLKQTSSTADSMVQPNELDVDTAAASCTAWLADGNKRALLAQVGVGTIDQALQAILMNRHQSLRMFGLFGKVLIVDEVHANDAYMHRLLRKLLEAHAEWGGSAILLSATLPKKMRNELFASYGATYGDLDSADYPLLTHAPRSGSVCAMPVDTPARVARRVDVDYRTDIATVLDTIVEAVDAQRCVVWIRNSVRDARTARSELTERLGAESVDLFHARYALGDRLKIENRVMRLFGVHSSAQERAGKVLIATQVVEQSLDLDFDLMVSDLAPIDLLIQRAGRLCRHVRDEAGNRKREEQDDRGVPVLVVYGPDPAVVESRNWLTDTLSVTSYVYPDHAALWLTARELKHRGGWSMPEDARELIETVYDDGREEGVPEVLQSTRDTQVGEQQANSSLAVANAIKMASGYKLETDRTWWTEINTPTRLGEKSQLVYLLRRVDGMLLPWSTSDDDEWALSRMTIPVKYLLEGNRGDEVDALKLQLPGRGKWCELVILEQQADSVWAASITDANGDQKRVVYTALEGLTYEHELT